MSGLGTTIYSSLSDLFAVPSHNADRQRDLPKMPGPPPCDAQENPKIARCPWYQECKDKGLQCKAFKMYVGDKTPMSFQLKHRGYKRELLPERR